ncbi:MAG: hypothetical protein QOD47_1039 [Gemmatimonadaceae bacterium]|jgi:hypothetical protein|nr:hypothetical protein [Gemmatimonadaceae bacterium]
MSWPIPHRIVTRLLAALTLFGALSALAGAVLAIAANGAGVPLQYLANSPFPSYAVPGFILGVVVGGTQLAAAIALLRRQRIAPLLSAIAGFGMLIWIFVELAIIRQYSWLQSAYFALGVLELILVLALLGILPILVVPIGKGGLRWRN